MNREPRCWAVVPAAGVGRRMGVVTPKQYLRLGDRRVIEHSLGRLLGHDRVEAAVVALGEADEWWRETVFAAHPSVIRVTGGAERCHSVHNGLCALARRASPDDWVLVHDAARPCLRRGDIDRLLETLAGHPVGGLLGMPVRDTMKRTDTYGVIVETVSRERLWHAFTPQMFRYGLLHEALGRALGQGQLVTDEAAAVERVGLRPMMVEGHPDNIKITRPEDLAMAEFFLSQQERTEE